MKKKSGSSHISMLLISVVLLCIIGVFSFINLGKWLIVTNSPNDHLDVIFTFAGENSRITYSKYLFRKNSNAQWIISYPGTKIKTVLYRENLDTSRITIVDTCSDTRAEVAYIVQWQHTHSHQLNDKAVSGRSPVIGLVSSWYHMRRIKLLLELQSKNESYSVRFLPALQNDSMGFKAESTWWKNTGTRFIVLSEWGKILYLYCNKVIKQT